MARQVRAAPPVLYAESAFARFEEGAGGATPGGVDLHAGGMTVPLCMDITRARASGRMGTPCLYRGHLLPDAAGGEGCDGTVRGGGTGAAGSLRELTVMVRRVRECVPKIG